MLTMRPLMRESVGGLLRRLRKTQGVSLDALSARTHIQRAFLELIEQDAYGNLPDILTARRMVGKVVEVLRGDAEYILARFDEECGACPARHTNIRLPRVRVLWSRLIAWPRLWLWAVCGFLTSVVVLFIALRAQALLGAPPLLVDSPNTDIHTTASTISIGGQTEPGAQLTVNDVSVYPDPTGRFSAPLPLRTGYNRATVRARRRFGKTATIVRQIFFEAPTVPAR